MLGDISWSFSITAVAVIWVKTGCGEHRGNQNQQYARGTIRMTSVQGGQSESTALFHLYWKRLNTTGLSSLSAVTSILHPNRMWTNKYRHSKSKEINVDKSRKMVTQSHEHWVPLYVRFNIPHSIYLHSYNMTAGKQVAWGWIVLN